MHADFQMQLVLNCHTAVLYEPISKLYIYTKTQPYIIPIVGLGFSPFFFFFFLQDAEIEKPDYTVNETSMFKSLKFFCTVQLVS